MNREEFNEMQDEFSQFLYNYEVFKRSAYILDLQFTDLFHEILIKMRHYEIENRVLYTLVSEKDKYKNKEDRDKFLQEVTKNYLADEANYASKCAYAAKILPIIYSLKKEFIEKLEATWKDFIRNYHPFLKLNKNVNAKTIFDNLEKIYFEHNADVLAETINLSLKAFETEEAKEEEFVDFSRAYYDFIKQANNIYSENKIKYPFTKEKVFTSQEEADKEKANLERDLNKLIEDNGVLQKEYKNIYGEELVFIETK